jgi:hypothetical protein
MQRAGRGSAHALLGWLAISKPVIGTMYYHLIESEERPIEFCELSGGNKNDFHQVVDN